MFTTLSPSPDDTATTTAAQLPVDFVRSCRTISLSNITLTAHKTRSLPKCLWMKKDISPNFRTGEIVSSVLASLPQATLAHCDALSDSLRPLLFNLAVLHAAIVSTQSSKRAAMGFKQARLSQFVQCVEEVLSSAMVRVRHDHTHAPRGDPVVILKMIQAHALHMYSCCLPRYQLEELVSACLSEEAAKPSGRVRLGSLGVELSVPSQAVMPRMFQDHVKGSLEAEEQSSKQHLIRLVQVNITGMYFHMVMWP